MVTPEQHVATMVAGNKVSKPMRPVKRMKARKVMPMKPGRKYGA